MPKVKFPTVAKPLTVPSPDPKAFCSEVGVSELAVLACQFKCSMPLFPHFKAGSQPQVLSHNQEDKAPSLHPVAGWYGGHG